MVNFEIISNGCTNDKIRDWYNKSNNYSFINEIMISKELFECVKDDLGWVEDQTKLYGLENKAFDSEVLYLSLEYKRYFDLQCHLVANCDLVLLYLRCEEELISEYYGTMTIEGFWSYLDTLPNIKPFLIDR